MSRRLNSEHGAETRDNALRIELPGNLMAARQARSAIREALAAWGMDVFSADAELLGSELVANAAEHGGGQPISLTLRPQSQSGGQLGLLCEVTDTSPHIPVPRQAGPDAERGRGLSIVTALAEASGVTPSPGGKTAWFTLTPPEPRYQPARNEPEAEAGGLPVPSPKPPQIPSGGTT